MQHCLHACVQGLVGLYRPPPAFVCLCVAAEPGQGNEPTCGGSTIAVGPLTYSTAAETPQGLLVGVPPAAQLTSAERLVA